MLAGLFGEVAGRHIVERESHRSLPVPGVPAMSSAAIQIASLVAAAMSAATAPQPAPEASVDPAAPEPQVVVPSDAAPAPPPVSQPARAATPAVAVGVPASQHRLLILPFVGYQKISTTFRDRITADAGTFGDGICFGVIAGGRLNRFLSLNAGLGYDTGNQ
jgi:hypothetical protein